MAKSPIREAIEDLESEELREMYRDMFDIIHETGVAVTKSDHGVERIRHNLREEAYQDLDHDQSGVLVMEIPFDVPWDKFEEAEDEQDAEE